MCSKPRRASPIEMQSGLALELSLIAVGLRQGLVNQTPCDAGNAGEGHLSKCVWFRCVFALLLIHAFRQNSLKRENIFSS